MGAWVRGELIFNSYALGGQNGRPRSIPRAPSKTCWKLKRGRFFTIFQWSRPNHLCFEPVGAKPHPKDVERRIALRSPSKGGWFSASPSHRIQQVEPVAGSVDGTRDVNTFHHYARLAHHV